MFEIKKGLALPTKKAGRTGDSKYLTPELKTAYDQMELNDAIEVPMAGYDLDAKKVSGWLSYYANKKYVSATHTKKFKTAVSTDGQHIIVQCCSVIEKVAAV